MNDLTKFHHDGGKAEKARLVARIRDGFRDLCALDPNVIELASIADTELRGMGYEPPPDPYAGPSSPPLPDPPPPPK
jgi:hypothetical protein